jgi:DNA recombination protein RmuC
MLIAILALTIVSALISFLVVNKLSSLDNSRQADDSRSRDLQRQVKELEEIVQRFELSQSTSLSAISTKLDSVTNSLDSSSKNTREELARNREELATTLKQTTEVIANQMRDLSKLQSEQLDNFARQLKIISENNRQDLTLMRETVEKNLRLLQEDNSKKLEEMRVTVDEKLQTTLEKRLSASFEQVSKRLELVHQGLGEMQSLAVGVGDLKKVLTNVKTRGTWGEIQLANLLEQILTKDQFEANVATKTQTQERVDFAIKLPGDEDNNKPVWLPIDSKFPQEDYQRLLEAQEAANPELADAAIKQLEARIKLEAKSIRDKYIDPPSTTDFALMFLPVEGLYAEVIRRPGLIDKLQREFRVNVVGPTTLAALLNSLQMGFRTLSIQKRSSEVWKLLADIKKHFGSFGDLLDKAQERVEQAGKVIEDASKRSRTIESRLKKVQELPEGGSVETALLN